MPRIHVKKTHFDTLLGKNLTIDELINFGFDYGIEIEKDDTDESKVIFEIGANRHDLSSVEGLAEAVGVYLGLAKIPTYNLVQPEKREQIIVKPATQKIRPFVVSAILRDITFDQDRYDSFIDLQDKLHQNICRKRTLVSIGTHDLDTLKGPFIYDAKAPKDIKFTPLNQTEEMDAERLMTFYETDNKLREYLPIIRDSPVYPVILDSNGVVGSLPPIINGDHSKIRLTTKNVLIEVTATDYTKASIVLNIVATMFSRYCAKPFTFEQVDVVYEHSGETKVTPDVSVRDLETEVKYINTVVGVEIDADTTVTLLQKMGLNGKKLSAEKISVQVPINRSDILHPCDIAEDVAIAYGINNIPFAYPSTSTTGGQLTINKISDLVRQEVAQAGYSECLNFALCSIAEISELINRKNGLDQAVQIGNPKTKEFQVGRTCLLPGLLKSLASNKAQKFPLNLFEVGDVILKAKNEVGSRNERRLACIHTNENTSGFELIHGFLDYLMIKLNIPSQLTATKDTKKKVTYSVRESQDGTFFPGMQAEILLNGQVIGNYGIIHPQVLTNFNWTYPSSYLELNLEQLINEGFLKNN
jgi:phenylalanyl-tRNA synthetase beta chain